MEKTCQLCEKTIKSHYKRHYNICLKNGGKIVRKNNTNPSPRKGKTYLEIYGKEKAELVKSNLIANHKPRIYTDEQRDIISKKMSEIAKAKNYGGYKPGGGRGKSGWFKGYWCDSSYELAWVIYNLDHNIKFERNTERFIYISSGITRYWIPDFILENKTR